MDASCSWCIEFADLFSQLGGIYFLLCSSIFILLFISFLRLYVAWKGIKFSKNIKWVDATHWEVPYAEAMQPIISQLNSLGFKRLGEFHGIIQGITQMVWSYVSADETTVVTISHQFPANPSLVFNTWYGDNALVTTSYPAIEDIFCIPNCCSMAVQGSLEEAHDKHMKQLGEFDKKHGSRVRFSTIDDWLLPHPRIQANQDYVNQSNRYYVRRYLVAPTLAYLYAILVFVAVTTAGLIYNLSVKTIWIALAFLSLPFWIAIVWIKRQILLFIVQNFKKKFSR